MAKIKETVLGLLGVAKHYLGLANSELVSDEELVKRYEACNNCPNKNKAFFGADTCGVCGCPLYQKLALKYDPKESEIKGELVLNHCPDPKGQKW